MVTGTAERVKWLASAMARASPRLNVEPDASELVEESEDESPEDESDSADAEGELDSSSEAGSERRLGRRRLRDGSGIVRGERLAGLCRRATGGVGEGGKGVGIRGRGRGRTLDEHGLEGNWSRKGW